MRANARQNLIAGDEAVEVSLAIPEPLPTAHEESALPELVREANGAASEPVLAEPAVEDEVLWPADWVRVAVGVGRPSLLVMANMRYWGVKPTCG